MNLFTKYLKEIKKIALKNKELNTFVSEKSLVNVIVEKPPEIFDFGAVINAS